MTQATGASPETGAGKKRLLMMTGAVVLFAACGFASTYLGFWSPAALLEQARRDKSQDALGDVVFLGLPRIEHSLPGSGGRNVVLSVSIETGAEHAAGIEQLTPRLLDAFNAFVAGIDPAAYDKRGVLEIVRAELMTRARQILGEEAVKGLLITEFLIR
ncbi:flagellar basal body-associated FliL family protein [Paracoccus seriniphilus]|uniref:Flagellar protein FliL n=1 Tax=Paracoccus seriniphilus TaxID=184748 RepID=A0A239PSL4_9RHOB|nr:flagellar basal body-associated FliL family protein [Paracoccus seriniphilus]WCR14184.1 flagellar basal body-associated FliL family protein [Paracoccus seriniphilus]SNT73128.1 flagellar FliL protein [Paracoccus seriniphilus]